MRDCSARARADRRPRGATSCAATPTDHSGTHAQRSATTLKVLITLTDVEPAVRLNAQLERSGVETAVVSPLDDIRGAIRRAKPDVIVMTGALVDPHNVALVREMLWDGVPVVGLADVRDPEIDERLRAIGFVEVFAKPIVRGRSRRRDPPAARAPAAARA